MVEDYRPLCGWCQKPMNNKARMYFSRTKEPLCYKCFTWFKEQTSKAGFKTDMGERYP